MAQLIKQTTYSGYTWFVQITYTVTNINGQTTRLNVSSSSVGTSLYGTSNSAWRLNGVDKGYYGATAGFSGNQSMGGTGTYDFTRGSSASSFSLEVVSFWEGAISNSITINIPAYERYLYTYDANGGTAAKTSEYHYANIRTTLPNATRYDYTLTGWLGSDGVTYAVGASVNLSQNLTFTAQWQGIYHDAQITINALNRCDNYGVSKLDGQYCNISTTYILGRIASTSLDSYVKIKSRIADSGDNFIEIYSATATTNNTLNLILDNNTNLFPINNTYEIQVSVRDIASTYSEYTTTKLLYLYTQPEGILDVRWDKNLISLRKSAPENNSSGESYNLYNNGIAGLVLWENSTTDGSDIWLDIESTSSTDQSLYNLCSNSYYLQNAIDTPPSLSGDCICDCQTQGELITLGKKLASSSLLSGLIIGGPTDNDGDLWLDLSDNMEDNARLYNLIVSKGWLNSVTLSNTLYVVAGTINYGLLNGLGSYSAGDKVILHAICNEGYTVEGWYENDVLLQSGGDNFVINNIAKNYNLTVKLTS